MTEPLSLIAALIRALDEHRIRYCHWKSSAGLAVALAGETDLDLLVDRRHAGRFRALITHLGFKSFISHEARRLPGVEDWLGLDTDSRHLVHLHVYEQLVLGEELVKNHRLPIEDVLLDHTQRHRGLLVPVPELELAVLAVRALLKYRDDALARDLIRIGHRDGLPASISAEVTELLSRTTPADVGTAIDRLLPMLPSPVIVSFLDAVNRRPIDGLRIRRLRLELEAALRVYTRLPTGTLWATRMAAAMNRSRFARVVRKAAERLRGRPSGRRKRPAAGGRTVAIVGIDGSGKTTVIEALVATFGWRVNVATLYLGSSRPGLRTRAAQSVTRAIRRLNGRLPSRGHEAAPATRLRQFAIDTALGLRAVAEAGERKRRIQLGSNLAAKGWLVFFDRYPMPALEVGSRRMDAHRLAVPSASTGWFVARLAGRERSIYRRIGRPDLTIVLRIDAAAARARKPKAPDALEAKAAALADLEEGNSRLVVIDAAAPLDDVLRQATIAVWDRLG